MKFLALLVLIVTSSAFAGREVVCSNLNLSEAGQFYVTSTSSCTDYYEVYPNVFAANQGICLSVMTDFVVTGATKKVTAQMKKLLTVNEERCLVGTFTPGSLKVNQILKRSELNVEF